MRIGLLWFDDDPNRTLEDKVLRAAAHYERKYGHTPQLCFVHPAAFDGNGNGKMTKAGEVEIRANRSILPDHFWLGVDEQNGEAKDRRSLVARVETEGAEITPQRARQLLGVT